MAEVEESARSRTLSGDSESDPDPYFEPIIQLPEVKVPVDEETETVLVKIRAKLYRFDTSNEDGPEWKERGTGEVKLLTNEENHSCRIVMRRDKTLKVCANHFITPWMELKPSFGSDKAFVYTTAADFADEIIKSECLAIKFSNVETANLFKDKFNEAKTIVSTKCELYINNSKENTDDSEDDEVAEKLDNLSLSKDSKEEK